MNDLNQNIQQLEDAGIKLILVDIGENAAVVQRYMDKNNIGLDVFLDFDSKIAEEYGLIGVPTFFFIDKDGIVSNVEHELPTDIVSIFN